MVKRETTIQQTADTVTEMPMFITFGLIPFMIRPVTLGQLQYIGAAAERLTGIEFNEKNLNAIAAALYAVSREGNREDLLDVVVYAMFRSRWMRWLFRKHINKHLTMCKYEKVLMYMATHVRATFFLTSLFFLKGIVEIAKPTNTPEAKAPGQSSEE